MHSINFGIFIKLMCFINIFQMMTTSISGQAPSLVPSSVEEQKSFFPSIVPTIPVEQPPIKEEPEEKPIAEEPVPELPPATVLSIGDEEEPLSLPEEPSPQNILHHGNFGSRTSAFVPYVNLNNFIPHRTESMIPSYSTAEPLYIPPTTNITAPIQMYSTAGLDNEANKSWNNNNFEMMTTPDSNAVSVLSQYFSAQNQVRKN